MKYCLFIILLFKALIPVTSFAQSSPVHMDSLDQKLADYARKYPQEKVYLHTDQNLYIGAQTIWYKAYTMAYGKPSQLSKILYVRLSDPQGKAIKQDQLPVINGTAYGNIELPDSLTSDWYTLQAFTAWMLNFDEDGIYQQKIYIQNVHDHSAPTPSGNTSTNYHINFFPEGGDLVEGGLCNVAFKATDSHGLPIKVSGEVLDYKGRSIAKLITEHDGMGSFEMEAFANANYSAAVHFPDSSVQTVPLPRVKNAGLILRVDPSPTDFLALRIASSEAQKDIVLTAVQSDGLIASFPLQLSHGINLINLKKKSLSTGIVRLTVLDDTGLPLAERIVYVDGNDGINLSLGKDTLSYSPKGKNVFTLNVKDNRNHPVKTNLSVVVTDADNSPDPNENICSYFLMSSELHGNIHNPAYYFQNNSDTLAHQLNLVMLTNGWRHFKWDDVWDKKTEALKYVVENRLLVAGKIDNYRQQDNLRIKMMINNVDSTKKIIIVEPDTTGMFVLKDYDQQGTANIYYQVINKKGRNQPVKIHFISPATDTIQLTETSNELSVPKPLIRGTFIDSVQAEQKELFMGKGIVLKTVNIKAVKSDPVEELIKSHVRNLTPDRAYTLDMVNNTVPSFGSYYGGVLQYINGRIPGLQIIYDPKYGIMFAYRGAQSLDGAKDIPAFYIDEVSSTMDEVMTIPMDDIAMVRFAPSPVWFAPLNGGPIGAIMVYTKRPADYSGKSGPSAFGHYSFNGYSLTREYAYPDHHDLKQRPPADYRTTLFWSHDLNTDKQGNVQIRFINSEKAKKYRVIIQAMDQNGRLGTLDENF